MKTKDLIIGVFAILGMATTAFVVCRLTHKPCNCKGNKNKTKLASQLGSNTVTNQNPVQTSLSEFTNLVKG